MKKDAEPDNRHSPRDQYKRDVTGDIHVRGEVECKFPPNLAEQINPGHKEYKARADKKRTLAIATFIVLVIYTSAALIQGWLLHKSITNNTKQFQIDQRPYVWDNNLKPGVSIQPNQRMWANITMINFGKSPALRTRIVGKIFFGATAMGDADHWFAQIGDKPLAGDPNDKGTVIPPGIPPPAQPLSGAELLKPAPPGTVKSEPGTFGGGGYFTVMTDKVLKQSDVDYVLGNEESAVIVAHLQYFDGFGNFYWSNICLSRFTSGSVPHCTRNNEIH